MKFKLTTETKIRFGCTLYRIEALVDFGAVNAGERGGFVEAEKNLSQEGDAWVYGNARVSPVNVIGLNYMVTIADDQMVIGCEHHSIADWRGFDDRRIIQMDGARAARFWKLHGPYLLAICDERAKAREATE